MVWELLLTRMVWLYLFFHYVSLFHIWERLACKLGSCLMWTHAAKYLLAHSKVNVSVILHKDSVAGDVLKSYIHAIAMLSLMEKSTASCYSEGEAWMDKHYDEFLNKVTYNNIKSTVLNWWFSLSFFFLFTCYVSWDQEVGKQSVFFALPLHGEQIGYLTLQIPRSTEILCLGDGVFVLVKTQKHVSSFVLVIPVRSDHINLLKQDLLFLLL